MGPRRERSAWLLSFATAISLGCGSSRGARDDLRGPALSAAEAKAQGAARRRSSSQPKERAQAVDAVIPRVVLILGERADGQRDYGAGIVLARDGLALTNLHVVADAQVLKVLLYESGRTTYSPLDGGISRLVFENEDSLKKASVVRADPLTDLAVIRIDMKPRKLGALPRRRTPLEPGERVFALGHPKESVWSFTSGVVSAIHQGVIQHDAPINQGNSGGPLIDSRGNILGVNTMKLVGDTEGIGFARPMALAAPLIHVGKVSVSVDRKTPERAMMSCERALELQPDAVDLCLDWDSVIELENAVIDEASRLLELSTGQTRRLKREYGGDREEIIADYRVHIVAHLAGRESSSTSAARAVPSLFSSPNARDAHLRDHHIEKRLRQARAQYARALQLRDAALRKATGLSVDISSDGVAYRELRRRGLRVKDAEWIGEDVAWLLVQGRNHDERLFHYSECWRRKDGAWRQPLYCSDELNSARPPDWPPALVSAPHLIRGRAISLAFALAELRPH